MFMESLQIYSIFVISGCGRWRRREEGVFGEVRWEVVVEFLWECVLPECGSVWRRADRAPCRGGNERTRARGSADDTARRPMKRARSTAAGGAHGADSARLDDRPIGEFVATVRAENRIFDPAALRSTGVPAGP